MKAGMPLAGAGQKIGLLGGSFDPPHAGHVHLTKVALKRFGLDRVWWLVSPGNPLKSEGPATVQRRLLAARQIMDDPRVEVTDLESRLNTRFTAETLEQLQRIYPSVRFSWLMGGDNLASVHRWERWPSIFATVPVGVLARPGTPIWARTAYAARLFRAKRLPSSHSHLLGGASAPCWCYLRMPLRAISSSEIRAKGGWVR
ncbi:nicotinate-nucleotide adenylyltransferase [Qingshengfaniella alkalisoli]|uniref:Probable nicotinate-nucleotide adenylyltransferase n=1 Tax=Qingshengfaniella alkalisoli TaxID=2599296 RepID=A0A5B8IWB7_9RHOB|nr:nicotinate-nucleotide adenylyltransferase [Qingshengfaniella alkalisoli]QDY68818.1 nicotinate-nucleotide adenylyltransferase [Qingshengfaniella alkalisoli]